MILSPSKTDTAIEIQETFKHWRFKLDSKPPAPLRYFTCKTQKTYLKQVLLATLDTDQQRRMNSLPERGNEGAISSSA